MLGERMRHDWVGRRLLVGATAPVQVLHLGEAPHGKEGTWLSAAGRPERVPWCFLSFTPHKD